MSSNAKKALISLMGGAGFIVLIIGFTDVYSVWIGVVGAFAIWVVTGAVSALLGVKK
jgi:hypothetical protein